MRAILEALGADIIWDGTNQTVYAIKGHRVVKVRVGSSTAWIREVPYSLRAPAVLYKDTTFVPLRFVSEAMGAEVTWTEATKTIDIGQKGEPAPPVSAEKVVVKRVVDRATVELDDGRQVRLIGVDTPDMAEPEKAVEAFGPKAAEFMKTHLTGATVYLEYDVEKQDTENRTLAYIWLEDGQLFNAVLIREGYSRNMTMPPNVKYGESFGKLQETAQELQLGLWHP